MNPIKPSIKSEIFPLFLIALSAIASIYFYLNFPEMVPTHWNFAGEVDAYGPRTINAFLLPVVILGMYILFIFIPFLDPKKERYEEFRSTYHNFKNVLVLFMSVLYFIIGFSALGYNIPVGAIIPALIGLLFVFIGSIMGKLKPNWFMGIRTPWTLSSEEVWKKTHLMGGKIFMAAGILMIVSAAMPISFRLPIFILAIILMSLGTVGYSYFVYYQQNHKA